MVVCEKLEITMPARSSLLSRQDLDFLLYDWLNADGLTARKRFAEHSRETSTPSWTCARRSPRSSSPRTTSSTIPPNPGSSTVGCS
jgi:hypothetical protein